MRTVKVIFYDKNKPVVKLLEEGSVDEVVFVHPGSNGNDGDSHIVVKAFSIPELVNILTKIEGDKFYYVISDDLKPSSLANVLSALQFVLKPNDEVLICEQDELKRIPVVMWGGPVKYISGEEIFYQVCKTPRKWAINGFLRSVLSPNERKVLREIVLRAASSSQIARKFGKSPKTVEHQIRNIYIKAREWFNLPKETPLDRKFLINHFREAFTKRRLRRDRRVAQH